MPGGWCCLVFTRALFSHAFLLGYSDICRVTGCGIVLPRTLLGPASYAEPSDTQRLWVRGRTRRRCVKCVWVDRIGAFHRLKKSRGRKFIGLRWKKKTHDGCLLLAKMRENNESGQPSVERAKLAPEQHLISRLPLFFSTDEIKAELEKQKWVLTQPAFEWTWWMITQPWIVCVCVFSLPPLPVIRAQTLGVKLALRLSEVKLGLLAATEWL